ncbi:MAG: 2TM domain-containing protein [Burkholderiaceae bacterium]
MGLWALVAAAITAAALVWRSAPPAGSHFDATQRRFDLPGSAVPLLLILAIFLTKYGVAVELALQPQRLQDSHFVYGLAATYGAFNSILFARALRLWRLVRPPPSTRSCAPPDQHPARSKPMRHHTTPIDPAAPLSGEQIEALAHQRASARIGWFFHASLYVLVIGGLALLGATQGRHWPLAPALGWGLGLAIHGIRVFAVGTGSRWRHRLVERERERLLRL